MVGSSSVLVLVPVLIVVLVVVSVVEFVAVEEEVVVVEGVVMKLDRLRSIAVVVTSPAGERLDGLSADP